jgi:hypothetical protein
LAGISGISGISGSRFALACWRFSHRLIPALFTRDGHGGLDHANAPYKKHLSICQETLQGLRSKDFIDR